MSKLLSNTRSTLVVCCVLAALSLHSFIAGLALGTSDAEIAVFVAIIAHKGMASTLGLLACTHRMLGRLGRLRAGRGNQCLVLEQVGTGMFRILRVACMHD